MCVISQVLDANVSAYNKSSWANESWRSTDHSAMIKADRSVKKGKHKE